MKPIDFVVFDGDSEPNQPVYAVAEAMMKDITVLSPEGLMSIRGYYFDSGRMVLEVALKEQK